MTFRAFDFEEGNQRLQLLALTGELLSGTGHLLGGGGILLNDPVELLNRRTDLFGTGILFSAGRSDLLHQFSSALDIRRQIAEDLSGFFGNTDAVLPWLPPKCANWPSAVKLPPAKSTNCQSAVSPSPKRPG
jgi:hypothetical protein